ncbi:MAG: DUF1566 domain-containing protein [Bacteroidaceae bacterium]|nr:DUF1566 domain-containing protein [Bacteroidaceae bacterium]
MKKILFTLISMLAFVAMANAQSMKVYQDGQLKAIYYVSKDDKVEFSDDFPFPQTNNMVNGHEYVDLGLSVKWATCNIGADTPEDYGWYFAWGETSPKSYYEWDTYKWGTGVVYIVTKYCESSSYGTVDNKTTLEPADDAAYVNWGGSWRMPTKAELDELRTKCTWTWTNQNGIYGRKVVGPNGNSIFLPATGWRFQGSLNDTGSIGSYWSSSLYPRSYNAYHLYLSEGEVDWWGNYRIFGRSVRPVCP